MVGILQILLQRVSHHRYGSSHLLRCHDIVKRVECVLGEAAALGGDEVGDVGRHGEEWGLRRDATIALIRRLSVRCDTLPFENVLYSPCSALCFVQKAQHKGRL